MLETNLVAYLEVKEYLDLLEKRNVATQEIEKIRLMLKQDFISSSTRDLARQGKLIHSLCGNSVIFISNRGYFMCVDCEVEGYPMLLVPEEIVKLGGKENGKSRHEKSYADSKRAEDKKSEAETQGCSESGMEAD